MLDNGPKRQVNAKSNGTEPLVFTLLDPKLASAIENLCQKSLMVSSEDAGLRSAIARLILTLKMLARDHMGCDSIEVKVLSDMLQQSNPRIDERSNGRPRLRTDLLKRLPLDLRQAAAAREIRSVWSAAEVAYEVVKTSRLDGMPRFPIARSDAIPRALDDSDLRLYEERYRPWALDQQHIYEDVVSHLSVVYDVVIRNRKPSDLDSQYEWSPGTALGVLCRALTDYHSRMGDDPAESC